MKTFRQRAMGMRYTRHYSIKLWNLPSLSKSAVEHLRNGCVYVISYVENLDPVTRIFHPWVRTWGIYDVMGHRIRGFGRVTFNHLWNNGFLQPAIPGEKSSDGRPSDKIYKIVKQGKQP